MLCADSSATGGGAGGGEMEGVGKPACFAEDSTVTGVLVLADELRELSSHSQNKKTIS
jgi:hypothetical protein